MLSSQANPGSAARNFGGTILRLIRPSKTSKTYFGNRIEDWQSQSPADSAYFNLSDADRDKSDLLLAKAIQSDTVPLPSPTFVLHSAEWRYCLEFFETHKAFFDSISDSPDQYAGMQSYARALSKSGRSRTEIMGIFSAAHSYCLRRNRPEDILGDVMDGISNSYGKGNPHNLDLP